MVIELVIKLSVVVFLVFDILLSDFETKPLKNRLKKTYQKMLLVYISIKLIQLSMHGLIDKMPCLFLSCIDVVSCRSTAHTH